MLWVNLIMDTLASLALATQPPGDHLLERSPQKKTEYIVSRKMWKHIFGQAFIQIIIIFSMMYAGEWFLPEYGDKDDDQIMVNPENEDMVRSGRLYKITSHDDYYEYQEDPDIGPSRHFTYIFNIFVLMQLFNEFCARKIKDECNIFEGLI
jgi:Ca2+ transporting ATPase